MPIAAAAFVYFFLAFAAGFILGIPRTLLIEPWLGPIGAVAIEAPIMLIVCWLASGWVLRRFAPRVSVAGRAAVGLLWLALLLSAELVVGLWVRKLHFEEVIAGYAGAPGLMGLTIQAICATFPLRRD